ncbi:DUF1631 family protein [Chitinimonas sp.]|uniref:DUF1631 family protein n=1 Tax=Chitinimonas sp. TaxID=1934313 RepID=UPI0035B38E37
MDNPALLAALRETFEHLFLGAVEPLFVRAAERLLAKADAARSSVEAGNLLDARAVLVSHGVQLSLEVRLQCHRLLDRALYTAYRYERPVFGRAADSGELSLLDTSVIEAKLALEMLTSLLRNAAESQLPDFNARIARLYQQADVRERENPFRPYVMVNALISAVASLGLVQELGSLLSRELVESLEEEVSSMYGALNDLLASHDINAALPRLRAARPARADAGFGGVGADLIAPQSLSTVSMDGLLARWVQMKTRPAALLAKDSTIAPPSDTLRNSPLPALLRGIFESPGPRRAASAASTFSGSTLLASAISELEREALPAAGASAAAGLRNIVFENRSRLAGMSKSTEEKLVIDVVAMLFEFILRDGQVPGSVRSDLGRTQFVILKHALFDPQVFSQAEHPARRLLNRIASVAMGFTPADPVTLAIRKEISSTVDQLLAASTIDAALFADVLGKFDAFVDTTLRWADPAVGRAVRVLEGAEGRALGYVRISNEIGELIRGIDVDRELAAFLVNTWAQVLERAGRECPDKLPALRQVVPRLIWTVQPKASNESRVQLLKLLPEMVGVLSEGLALSRWSQPDCRAFLDELVNAHVVAMRDGNARDGASLQSIEAHFDSFVRDSGDTVSRLDNLPFDASLVGELAQELNAHLALLDRQLAPVGDGELPDLEEPLPDEHYTAKVMARLRTGIMIEFMLEGIPRRARLNWISTRAASILLTIEEVSMPTAVSLGLFQRLWVHGQIRFLEAEPMFERAVNVLLRTADEMEHWLSSQGGDAALVQRQSA